MWLARLLGQLGWMHRELQDFETAREHDREAFAWPASRRCAGRRRPMPCWASSSTRPGAGSSRWGTKTSGSSSSGEHPSAPSWPGSSRSAGRAPSPKPALPLATSRGHGPTRRGSGTSPARRARPPYEITAHKLLADLALRQDRPQDAEAPLAAAVDLMRRRPCPLVGWRTFATLGRVRKRLGSAEDARAAFGEAAAIVHRIAASVDDEPLRRRFLDSPAVKDVMENARA